MTVVTNSHCSEKYLGSLPSFGNFFKIKHSGLDRPILTQNRSCRLIQRNADLADNTEIIRKKLKMNHNYLTMKTSVKFQLFEISHFTWANHHKPKWNPFFLCLRPQMKLTHTRGLLMFSLSLKNPDKMVFCRLILVTAMCQSQSALLTSGRLSTDSTVATYWP